MKSEFINEMCERHGLSAILLIRVSSSVRRVDISFLSISQKTRSSSHTQILSRAIFIRYMPLIADDRIINSAPVNFINFTVRNFMDFIFKAAVNQHNIRKFIC